MLVNYYRPQPDNPSTITPAHFFSIGRDVREKPIIIIDLLRRTIIALLINYQYVYLKLLNAGC